MTCSSISSTAIPGQRGSGHAEDSLPSRRRARRSFLSRRLGMDFSRRNPCRQTFDRPCLQQWSCCPRSRCSFRRAGPGSRRRAGSRPAVRAGRPPGGAAARVWAGRTVRAMDVNALFDEPTVALRGPWNPVDLVKIAPSARISSASTSTTSIFRAARFSQVATTSAGRAGSRKGRSRPCTRTSPPSREAGQARPSVLVLLRLQRLQQPPRGRLGDDPAQLRRERCARGALQPPVEVGFSSARRRRARLVGGREITLDGTHPVVFPAAGSHANKYTEDLYLGSSAEAGVGCDDTQGPHSELRPVVETIPSDPAAAEKTLPGSPSAAGENSRRRFSTGRPGRT